MKDVQIKRLFVTIVFSIIKSATLRDIFSCLTQNPTGQEAKERMVYCARKCTMTQKEGSVRCERLMIIKMTSRNTTFAFPLSMLLFLFFNEDIRK